MSISVFISIFLHLYLYQLYFSLYIFIDHLYLYIGYIYLPVPIYHHVQIDLFDYVSISTESVTFTQITN